MTAIQQAAKLYVNYPSAREIQPSELLAVSTLLSKEIITFHLAKRMIDALIQIEERILEEPNG